MSAMHTAPAVPAPLAFALQPLPTAPLEVLLQRLVDSILARHPHVLDRLGSEGARRFGIDLSDLPFALLIEVRKAGARLRVLPRLEGRQVDARIAGNLLVLIDLVNGRYDGDAVFFSRELSVEGDIEAVLALRNAIDDAEIDLTHELAQLAGPWSWIAEQAVRSAAYALTNAVSLAVSLGRRSR